MSNSFKIFCSVTVDDLQGEMKAFLRKEPPQLGTYFNTYLIVCVSYNNNSNNKKSNCEKVPSPPSYTPQGRPL